MNTLQRPLFDAPMPMVEGSGITSMAMEESAGEKLGADLTATIAQGVAETESAIDAADDNVGIMNALRGKQASEEEYRTELASYVGRKDANATPESVLALVQPTIAMMELGEAPMGGIGDMMPPQTFGVEEEVFGKLPVQKLQAGGLAGRVAGIQALQKQFLPSEEQIQQAFAVQQPTTAQNLLAVGAPFVQGLLAPSQQGGGLNAALSLASQAASQQIAAQRETEQASKQRIAQALLNQQMQSGQSALTAGLAQEQQALDRLGKIAEARAKGPTLSDVGKLLQEQKQFPVGSREYQEYEDRIQKLNTITDPTAAIIAQLGANTELENRRASLREFAKQNESERKIINEDIIGPVAKGLEEYTQIVGLLEQGENFAETARTGVGGDFKNRLRNVQLAIKEFAPELAGLTEKTIARLTSADIFDEDTATLLDQRAAVAGLRSVNAQLALAFTKYFPGNLNQAEVEIAQRAASGDLNMSAQEFGVLKEIFDKTRRAKEALSIGFREVQDNFAKTNYERLENNEQMLPQYFLRQELLKKKEEITEQFQVDESERGSADLERLGSQGYNLTDTPIVTSSEATQTINKAYARILRKPDAEANFGRYFAQIMPNAQETTLEQKATQFAKQIRQNGVQDLGPFGQLLIDKALPLPYTYLQGQGFDMSAIGNIFQSQPRLGLPRQTGGP